MNQLYWDDVQEGDALQPLAFPLTVYRLVVAAGANRDFNAIHHNSEYAKASGAPEIYANTLFLQGMWERSVREYIGLAGTIHSLSGFRMNSFNCVGDIVIVQGNVKRKWRENDQHLLEISLWSTNGARVSVGPGAMVVGVPTRKAERFES